MSCPQELRTSSTFMCAVDDPWVLSLYLVNPGGTKRHLTFGYANNSVPAKTSGLEQSWFLTVNNLKGLENGKYVLFFVEVGFCKAFLAFALL